MSQPNQHSIFQQFINKLEKKGFFEKCTEQQREVKMKTAQKYFEQHYSLNSSFVVVEKKESDEKIRKLADEHKLKGNEYLNSKDFAKSITEYTEAIKLCEDPVYFANRSAAYCSIEENDLAIEDAKKAIDLDPNYAKAYARLAVALTKKQKYIEAQKAIEDALKIDPNNVVFKSNLDQIKCLIRNNQNPPNSTNTSTVPTRSHNSTSNTPQNASVEANEKKEEKEEEEESVPTNEQRNSNGIGQDGPQVNQPQNPFANIFSGLNNLGGQGMNFNGIDFNSLMGAFSGQGSIAPMARSLLGNPAMRPMISMIAQSMGMSAEELQRLLDEELNGENQPQNQQSPRSPPPGFV